MGLIEFSKKTFQDEIVISLKQGVKHERRLWNSHVAASGVDLFSTLVGGQEGSNDRASEGREGSAAKGRAGGVSPPQWGGVWSPENM